MSDQKTTPRDIGASVAIVAEYVRRAPKPPAVQPWPKGCTCYVCREIRGEPTRDA